MAVVQISTAIFVLQLFFEGELMSILHLPLKRLSVEIEPVLHQVFANEEVQCSER